MAVKQLLIKYSDWNSWPTVDSSVLSYTDEYRYIKLHNAIIDVCQGALPRTIRDRYGISKSLMAYYIDRCLKIHPDGKIFGFRALIAYSRTEDYKRTKDIDKIYTGSGLSGAFSRLMLDNPEVNNWLISKLEGKRIAGVGIKLSALHQDFLTELRKSGCQTNRYPFTTSRHAYESFCAYVKKLRSTNNFAMHEMCWGEGVFQGKGRNVRSALLKPIVSLERCAYDEYSLPNISTIEVSLDFESAEIPLNRLYFCPIVDYQSVAILGFSLSIGRGFNSSDISKAFEYYISPIDNKDDNLFRNFEKISGEGFPAEVIPFVKGRRICNLCLDNHLSHLANSVVVDLRKRTGISVTYGPVRSWINRYVVEGIFSELQEDLRLLPSSTGSGPSDPLVSNPVGQALKYKVNVNSIISLVIKLCRRHNAQRRRALMALTPNERISIDWQGASRFSIIPKYSGDFIMNPDVSTEKIWVAVRGNQSKGRVPYVQLDEAQYTNDILRQNWSLIGKKICVHVGSDYRTVKAFRENGGLLGVLSVSGVWALTPHDRQTRKEINRLYREGIFRDRSTDPVRMYQNYLASNILHKTSKKSSPKILKDAKKLLRTLSGDGVNNISARFNSLTESVKDQEDVKNLGRREFFSPGED
ncbi:hypothetical protein QYQ99_26965 [Comamonas testosteroni]|uniref:hypothetical protein n=1 Tax=Comamonas testosteroni TaxID=285 RepID=UPI00265D980E|nr:hypothetical protein [Comamonas testosteroni]WKL15909.1 hypothetical protein QYQ99_26965 [Comamonas testosteroni]